MEASNMKKIVDVSILSDSNLRFEKNIPYPHTLSALKKGILQEDIKPTLRARRQNLARYRTQPITFNEIREVDEENFALFQKGDSGNEPSCSSAGSHSESSVTEPVSPIHVIVHDVFWRCHNNMKYLASRRKSPWKNTFVKSASNEELAVNDETDNHPDDNNEKEQTRKSEGGDQPKEEEK